MASSVAILTENDVVNGLPPRKIRGSIANQSPHQFPPKGKLTGNVAVVSERIQNESRHGMK
jgi:hypothetical protein